MKTKHFDDRNRLSQLQLLKLDEDILEAKLKDVKRQLNRVRRLIKLRHQLEEKK